jgi:hypothetical protein
MAISQFYMAIIPKHGIIEYFGEVPKVLEVDFQKRTERFLNETMEGDYDYFEFIQHKCWANSKISSKEIINLMDQKLNRADWGNDNEGNNWKTETTEIDNDAWILVDEENIIIEFTFRADLRQPQLKFLLEMIELCYENEFLLIDIGGNVVEPDLEKVIELIKVSNAYKFVVNPNQYFTDFENCKNRIE